ncbi:MAG: type 1 glutamine amidotransferase domain-containing protein [Dermatophilaceae bacterium]
MTTLFRRALIVLTSHDQIGDTGRSTGFYVSEAAHPWQALAAAGIDVDLVSVRGGRPPMDGYDADDAVQREFLADPVIAAQLADTPAPDTIDSSRYDVVVFAGGHGTMWDFRGNADLQRVTREIYENGGVVAAVCHGPAGLVDVTLSDGTALVAGKNVAAFTNDEEDAVGLADVVPFLLADALVARGATHRPAESFAAQVVVDGRLVTGQNPASAPGLAQAVVRLLETERNHPRTEEALAALDAAGDPATPGASRTSALTDLAADRR